ncbi:hypothetical protein ACFLSQ_10690, partial [Bacteroidota bacterium]
VEGNDDELFFKSIIVPILLEKYHDIEVIQYAQMKKEKVQLFILSIKTLNFDYLLFGDIDFNSSVNRKKKYLEARFDNVDEKQIYIVIKEIESWYYAGVTDAKSREFGIKPMKNTNELVKEDFNQLYHKTYKSRIDFMLEILKEYSVSTAIKKNDSFRFFSENNFV